MLVPEACTGKAGAHVYCDFAARAHGEAHELELSEVSVVIEKLLLSFADLNVCPKRPGMNTGQKTSDHIQCKSLNWSEREQRAKGEEGKRGLCERGCWGSREVDMLEFQLEGGGGGGGGKGGRADLLLSGCLGSCQTRR